jgi:uncharacterized LabA/DUF88 family protein
MDMENPAATHLTTGSKTRAIVYVDGFNLYYGVLKSSPAWKWLNLASFFDSLRVDDEIVKICYFTAIVDEGRAASETRDRQKRYLNIHGKYQPRQVKCRATCRQPYQVPEEKKTDVNIAVRMLSDAIDGAADRLILVSGDSDIEPAIKWIRSRFPKIKVTVYIPQLPDDSKQRRNDSYRQMNVDAKVLPITSLSAHQFPKIVELPNGGLVERPKDWPL